MASVTITVAAPLQAPLNGNAAHSGAAAPAVAALPKKFDPVKIINALTEILERNIENDFLSQRLFQWGDALAETAKKLLQGGVVDEASYRKLLIPRIEYLYKNILCNPFKPEVPVKNAFFDGAWLWEASTVSEWKALAFPNSDLVLSPFDGEELGAKAHPFANEIIAWLDQLEPPNVSQSACKEADVKSGYIILQAPLSADEKIQKISQWILEAQKARTATMIRDHENQMNEFTAYSATRAQKIEEQVEKIKEKAIEDAAKNKASLNERLNNIKANAEAAIELERELRKALAGRIKLLEDRLSGALATIARQQAEITRLKDIPHTIVINKIKKRLL